MKIGVFQFCGSDSLSENHEAIIRGITSAAQNKVRLLVFQECATCGYPPVETPAIGQINFDELDLHLQEVQQLAKEHDMYIALGTIRKESPNYYNSIQLMSPKGENIGNYGGNQMDEKLVCPCGLTCCDCMFYKTEIYEAAIQLKNVLEKHNLVQFLTLCSQPQSLEVLSEHLSIEKDQIENNFSSSFAAFKQFPEFMSVLDGLINLQCKSTCKEVSGCSIGGNKHECKALKCIKTKGYEGCWQCDEFETCDKLSLLKRNYGYVIEENLKIIREKGVAAVESRGDKYYAWQRR